MIPFDILKSYHLDMLKGITYNKSNSRYLSSNISTHDINIIIDMLLKKCMGSNNRKPDEVLSTHDMIVCRHIILDSTGILHLP